MANMRVNLPRDERKQAIIENMLLTNATAYYSMLQIARLFTPALSKSAHLRGILAEMVGEGTLHESSYWHQTWRCEVIVYAIKPEYLESIIPGMSPEWRAAINWNRELFD